MVSPMTSAIGMRVVPVGNILGMLDRNDVADLSGLDDFLQAAIEGGVAQHVADLKNPAGFLAGEYETFTIPFSHGHRFLEKHVIARLQSAQRRLDVVAILSGDQREVRESRSCEEILGLGEAGVFGKAEAGCKTRAAIPISLRHRDDSTEFGMFLKKRNVCVGSTIARADHDTGWTGICWGSCWGSAHRRTIASGRIARCAIFVQPGRGRWNEIELVFRLMTARNQAAWLFGPIPDLLLGGGLLYLLVVSGLLAWGASAREVIPAVWIAYAVVILSGSHYGGTLLRVYEHSVERRSYRVFTVYGTVAMIAVLIAALYSPFLGSVLITVYLTWSPWHYTGQNYGIAVMFLRRRGVEISPLAKRFLYASFILSFFSVLLTMHAEGNGGRADPLGFSSLDLDTFRFISVGLPGALRNVLMPLVGIAYLGSVAGAAVLLCRAGGIRSFVPTALIMLTQAVWFSIPYFGSYVDLAQYLPALGAVEGETYQFYFVWVALGHSIQYLWITTYYARADRRWKGYGRYFSKVFVFGNAVWAAPVVLLAPDLLGRPDFDFGLAVCVAAAVNIHHFILDGAIWKLRNPRLAAILLGSQSDASGEASSATTLVWGRRLAWALAGLFCLARIVPYVEIDQRFPAALMKNDYGAAEAILDRAFLYGRDSTILRLRLANQIARSETPARSLRHYRRSLELHPHAEGYGQYGELTARFVDIEQGISAWESGLEKFPDDFGLVRHLGEGFLRTNRPRMALPYLERAIRMRPDDEWANRALEEAKARLGSGTSERER